MRMAWLMVGVGLVLSPTYYANDWSRVVERVRESVVLLSYPEAPQAVCSGFVFGKQRQYIVTARHCVFEDGKAWETHVGEYALRIVEDYDPEELVVLSPRSPGLAFRANALERGSAPRIGDPVASVGYYGVILDEATPMFLMVVAPNRTFSGRFQPGLLMNGAFLQGQSGGPVVDRHGRFVSVVVGIGIGPANGLAIGPSWNVMAKLPHD